MANILARGGRYVVGKTPGEEVLGFMVKSGKSWEVWPT